MSKMFSLSFAIAGLDVHGANPVDHFVRAVLNPKLNPNINTNFNPVIDPEPSAPAGLLHPPARAPPNAIAACGRHSEVAANGGC